VLKGIVLVLRSKLILGRELRVCEASKLNLVELLNLWNICHHFI